MKTVPKKPGQNAGAKQKPAMSGQAANRDQAGANRDMNRDRDNDRDRNRDVNRDNRR